MTPTIALLGTFRFPPDRIAYKVAEGSFDHVLVRTDCAVEDEQKNLPSPVTPVTSPSCRIHRAGVCFSHGLKNTSLRRQLSRARRGAQKSSPLAPLQRSWRGEGLKGFIVPKNFAKTLFARELRRSETFTEKIAWNMLRRGSFMNLKFRRQFVFRGFILDFYCFEHKLAVEIDGGIHEHQKEYDAKRQAILERHGLRFVRITAEELESNPQELLNRIRAVITSPKTPSTFPPPPSRSDKVEGG